MKGSKIFVLTVVFGWIVGTSAITIGYGMYSRSVDLFYADTAMRTAETVAALIDKDDAVVTRNDVLSLYNEYADRLVGLDDPKLFPDVLILS